MKKAAVVFSAAAVMAMTAVSVPTPVEARGGWGWGPGIAGGLIAGVLIGGLASNAYGYGLGYGYYGGPGPGYGYYGGYRPVYYGGYRPAYFGGYGHTYYGGYARLTTVTNIDRVYRSAYDAGGCIPRRADRASGAIPGPDFFVRTVPWFHGERLRDTSHRTIRSIERRGNSGGSR